MLMRENKGKNIIAFPNDYIVIDTETTGLDYEFCDIIEVCAIRFFNGQKVDSFTSLIKPRERYRLDFDSGEWVLQYVDSFITELTGITNDMLSTAPEPCDVIPALLEFIGDSVLIGHNVNFDINFLYDAAMYTCETPLKNNYIDTLRIARKLYPELSHHRLTDIAEVCAVDYPISHRADADCLTTARCYDHMRNEILTSTTESDFISSFVYNYEKSLSSVVATTDNIDITNPIYGKVIVFTGTLSSMARKEAFQIVANLGGIADNSVTKKTNYLVVGSAEFVKSVKEGKTNKIKTAESYQMKGAEISIISENAFFDLISGYYSKTGG